MRGEAGQSSVEIVGLLPVVLVIALAAGQLLAAGQARSLAGAAAQAAAMAELQGGAPEAAARAAAPDVPRERMAFRRSGARMVVRIVPRRVLPGLQSLLTAEATADAGPR